MDVFPISSILFTPGWKVIMGNLTVVRFSNSENYFIQGINGVLFLILILISLSNLQ